jgi:hypothetical protein
MSRPNHASGPGDTGARRSVGRTLERGELKPGGRGALRVRFRQAPGAGLPVCGSQQLAQVSLLQPLAREGARSGCPPRSVPLGQG